MHALLASFGISTESAWRFVRFATVGLLGAATYYLMLAGMIHLLHVPVMTATTIVFPIVALEMYLLHRRWTFRSKRSHIAALPLFIAMTAAGALINWSVIYVSINTFHINYLIAQAAAIGAVIVWNFTCTQLWIFRPALNPVAGHAE